MAGNTFGKHLRLTTFGESHGAAIGGVVDGLPAGLNLDTEQVQQALDRRRPGQSELTTQRKESDTVEFLSGIFEGQTTGTPIGFLIRNEDQRSKDYSHLKDTFRPSHADYTYTAKYGVRDYRGGGRASARETATRVVAGELARQLIASAGLEVAAYVSQIGEVPLDQVYDALDLSQTNASAVRCPDAETAQRMTDHLVTVRDAGDSVGGIITGIARNVPPGLGEPVFDKLHADLGKAMLSINAVKGFEIGSGFAAAGMRGSEHNDVFEAKEGEIGTRTNHSGGIQGGISNGQDIVFRVAFKPVATLMRAQSSVDAQGNPIEIEGKGRHDPCVVPRAVPIVEAMMCLVLADHWLGIRLSRI